MSENLKIRFRLSNGEEFEAEGPQDFIESQRADFLSLIGKSAPKHPQSSPLQTVQPTSAAVLAPAKPPTASIALTQSQFSLTAAAPVAPEPTYSTLATSPSSAVTIKHLWEHLLKEEGECLILRRKTHLSIQEAALLILAGAKHLFSQPDYRAILLAKSIKLSGFQAGRLDRILAGEIKTGYMTAKGSKRSRCYCLTPAGYTRAFVLAKKRVGEEL